MVALKRLGLPKTHEPQRGTNGPLARSQDRSCQQHLNMWPYAPGEQWHEWVQQV